MPEARTLSNDRDHCRGAMARLHSAGGWYRSSGAVKKAVIQERRVEARQHGAMEYSQAPTDLDAVRMYRLGLVS